MKKSTGSILLLSAFGAMVLAGCGKDGSSSPAAGSSVIAASASEDASASADSGNGQSSATAESSTTSSSTPAVETDWSNKNFIGEYKGGMNSLVINTDKTTSWGTSTDKFPATYTDLGGGVTLIKSTAEVADKDYVEIITDNNMAYVLHNKDAMDYYVMDKSALGSAKIAFAETTDEETFFGGIEATPGHWKYFACIDGTYHFGVTITIQAGTNINAGGAIFDYGSGSSKKSYKVTLAAPAATGFAKIEQINFTLETYTGDHGELAIGTDDDGLVFATLNGVAQADAMLSADGTTLSVPNGSAATSYDMANPAGPSKVVPTTTYTLAKIAHTYTEGEGTSLIPLFEEATGLSGTHTGETDAGGHLWVWFTAPVDGKITITEDIPTSYVSTSSYASDYLVIYDTSTTPLDGYDEYYSTSLDYDSGYGDAEISNCTVEAGHTYVVRLGASTDNSKDWTGTGSSYADETVAVSWVFTPFTLETYTGELGNIDIIKDGTTTIGVKINGTKVSSYTQTTSGLSTISKTLDTSDPTDPVYTVTTTTITLDATNGTYTANAVADVTHPFHALAETDTTYTGVTGADGNLWLTFTPSKDGSIEVTETAMGLGDSYISVYEYDPTVGIAGLKDSGGTKKLASDDNSMSCGVSASVSVKGGVTYVIKLGDWNSRNLIIGESTSYSEDVGCSETISFVFHDYSVKTYAGSDGDLVLTTKEGEIMSATLNGNPVAGHTAYDEANGIFSIKGQQTLDNTDPANPVLTSTDTVFTLDNDALTYAKTTEAGSEPVYKELTESSTVVSGYVGEDGNLWATFSPTHDGLLTVDETLSTSSDGYIAIYEANGTSYVSSNAKSKADYYGTYSGGGKITDFSITAGKTYVIKAGAYNDRDKLVGDTGSSNAGKAETFTFSFKAIYTNVYTCDGADDLTIKIMDGEVYTTPTLGTTPLNGVLAPNGKSYTVAGQITNVNASNPMDPVETRTTTTYYLDNDAMTYEASEETGDVHLFQTLSPTDTSLSFIVGKDGNLWATFTAPDDGTITVDETKTTSSDNYLQVFESTATAFKSTTKAEEGNVAHNDFGGTASGGGKVTNIDVKAGKTYVIKAGAYADRDAVPGDGTTSSSAGKTETISFTYKGFTHETFTGSEGNLVKNYFEGTYRNATLNGETFNATPNTDKTVYTAKSATFDPATFITTTTTKTYTLGEGTYEVDAQSTEAALLSASVTGGCTATYTNNANGSVIIAITPTVSGEYTFNVGAVTGKDIKIGLYSEDDLSEKGFGDALDTADVGYSNAGETITYELEAGKTYYLKASIYADFSRALTDVGSKNTGIDFTIEIVAPTDPEPTDPTPTDPEPTDPEPNDPA